MKGKKLSEKVMRRRDVESRTGLSRSTIYAMIANGTFPQPVKLGLRAVGWFESDIAEWLASRKAASVGV